MTIYEEVNSINIEIEYLFSVVNELETNLSQVLIPEPVGKDEEVNVKEKENKSLLSKDLSDIWERLFSIRKRLQGITERLDITAKQQIGGSKEVKYVEN